MGRLARLFRPESVAVIGGGTWCEAVISQCRAIGFDGNIWPVHPKRDEVAGLPAFNSLDELPSAPDAAFIGINRNATIEAVRQLSEMSAGGAVCFASGFQESEDGKQLENALRQAAEDMPFLGPNCYGFINALDRFCLWPDQHGLAPVDRGVGIIAQSSNIALNLTMQQRGLPLAAMITVGNQAVCSIGEIGLDLLNDERITALGIYAEGINDIRSFEAMCACARELGKRIVVLNSGASDKSRTAAVSHTAALTGSNAGSEAFFKRLGVATVDSPAVFLETLKAACLFPNVRIENLASLSCSGGEAGLMADLGQKYGLSFPEPGKSARAKLRTRLGAYVQMTNPLDYHTDIWRNREAMAEVFSAMSGGDIDLTVVVLDLPTKARCDPSDWHVTIGAVKDAASNTGRPFAVLATLPELMTEALSVELMESGILPLCGIEDGLAALDALRTVGVPSSVPLFLPNGRISEQKKMLDEFEAKAMLADVGVLVPDGTRVRDVEGTVRQAEKLGYPLAVKILGIAHKSNIDGVHLNIGDPSSLRQVVGKLPGEEFLLEKMASGAICELLVGVIRDPVFGYVLTLGSGGTLSEIIDDKVHLLLPSVADEIRSKLSQLKIFPQLEGYRGKPPACISAIVDCVLAIGQLVMDHDGEIAELEVNPLICREADCIAVDALMTIYQFPTEDIIQ